jgi:hypothetical protein
VDYREFRHFAIVAHAGFMVWWRGRSAAGASSRETIR